MGRVFSILATLALLGGAGAYWYVHFGPGKAASRQEDSESANCEKHGLPEAECPFCDPSLVEEGGLCKEHRVPEALCSRCNSALVSAFLIEEDWCEEHKLPESQCEVCHPGVLAQYGAAGGSLAPETVDLLPPEETPRTERAPNVRCKTHETLIQFRSPEIARATGLGLATVEEKPLKRTLLANAEIAYDANAYARLSPRAAGTLREIAKDLGAPVAAGEVLAKVECPEVAVAKVEYLRRLETSAAAETTVVRQEAFLERMNRLEVRLTGVDYLKAKELLEVAARNLEREEELRRKGSTSETDLLAARAEFLAAQAEGRALEKKLLLFGLPAGEIEGLAWDGIEKIEGQGTTSEEDLLEARTARAQAQAELEASRETLLRLGFAAPAIEELEKSRDISGELPILAPFAGVVVERSAVPGELVEPSRVVLAVADTSKVWALLDVAEADAAKVEPGQEVVLAVDGLAGETFGGRISWVATEVDPRTRMLKVRAVLDNSFGLLRAHQFARALVTTRGQKPAVLVPKAAVQWEGCCNVVFVKKSDVLFEPRKVWLGYETPEHHEVRKGLKAGEVVVTEGSFLLKTEIMKGSIGAGCCEFDEK
ncbi:MAG: efflux RND transporter periplasmic adaptor subunit [Planctomycetes bacterium]|nr:efflux RND transporter periplasmic adaptor subunit [Planctomycetota bacterium]